jgi:nitroreductase
MDALKAIFTRRSVRQYADEPISDHADHLHQAKARERYTTPVSF